MKKITTLLLSFLLLLGICPTKEANAISSDSTKEKITKVITSYVSNTLEMKKTHQYNDKTLKNIAQNTKLYEFQELLTKSNLKWYQGVNLQIDWYKVSPTINSLKIDSNNDIEVDATFRIDCQYTDVDFDTFYEENYIFSLSEVNGNFIIDKIIFEPTQLEQSAKKIYSSEENYDKYISELIADKKDFLSNIDDYIKISNNETESGKIEQEKFQSDINNGNSKAIKAAYFGNSASLWAQKNINIKEDYAGNDCTNFVSKALYWGGKMSSTSTWKPGSTAWINVISFRNFIINSKLGSEGKGIGSARVGEPIQLYHKTKKTWTHTLIATRVSGGNVYVSAHSNKALNKNFKDYIPGTSFYQSYRLLSLYNYTNL